MKPTKEPSKDFRQAVMDIIADAECNLDAPSEKQLTTDEFTDSILALCKEMLVPEKALFNVKLDDDDDVMRIDGWNACREHLLKQLGEK